MLWAARSRGPLPRRIGWDQGVSPVGRAVASAHAGDFRACGYIELSRPSHSKQGRYGATSTRGVSSSRRGRVALTPAAQEVRGGEAQSRRGRAPSTRGSIVNHSLGIGQRGRSRCAEQGLFHGHARKGSRGPKLMPVSSQIFIIQRNTHTALALENITRRMCMWPHFVCVQSQNSALATHEQNV